MSNKRLLMLTAVFAAATFSVSAPAAAAPTAYPPDCAEVTTNSSSYAPGAIITLTAQGEPSDEGTLVTFTITLTNGGPIDLPSLRVVPQGNGLGFSGVIARPQSTTTSIVVTAVVDANGTAVASVTAPLTIGSYLVTITNISCGEVSSSFVITPRVPPTTVPGRVPSAGGNTEPWLVAATSLVGIGLLLWVATRRRRQTSHA